MRYAQRKRGWPPPSPTPSVGVPFPSSTYRRTSNRAPLVSRSRPLAGRDAPPELTPGIHAASKHGHPLTALPSSHKCRDSDKPQPQRLGPRRTNPGTGSGRCVEFLQRNLRAPVLPATCRRSPPFNLTHGISPHNAFRATRLLALRLLRSNNSSLWSSNLVAHPPAHPIPQSRGRTGEPHGPDRHHHLL
jgi:hypothetical protein